MLWCKMLKVSISMRLSDVRLFCIVEINSILSLLIFLLKNVINSYWSGVF